VCLCAECVEELVYILSRLSFDQQTPPAPLDKRERKETKIDTNGVNSHRTYSNFLLAKPRLGTKNPKLAAIGYNPSLFTTQKQ